jgi:hypothetical protein
VPLHYIWWRHNNDGSGTNDLILYQQQHIANNGFSTNGSSSPAAQRAAYDNFISQDSYLSGREVNMRSAMEHFLLGGKWDMKLIQDYNFKIAAGKTNTIQFSVDVLNLSNY